MGSSAADDRNPAALMWARGDYGRIARLIGDLGVQLTAAADVRAGQRVLDVAAGTGNATLPAARTGAVVTATDLTPELLAEGEREARADGLGVRWVEADARVLPFDDGEFDVVLSCIGVMFAPEPAATAAELLRVCRPGGTVAMANWTRGGAIGRFLGLLARHSPPPAPEATSPLDWGDPERVRALLGPGCEELRTAARTVTSRFTGPPAAHKAEFTTYFPPLVALLAAGDPASRTALDAELLAFYEAEDSGPAGGPSRYDYEYLEVVGVRSGGQT